jgi:hypothetical protein
MNATNITTRITTDTADSPLKEKNKVLPFWLINLCRSKKIFWVAPLLGMLLSLPSLFSGYIADDHLMIQNVIDNSPYIKQPVLEYFTLISSDTEAAYYRDKGIVGWWTPDQFRIKFFRPLACLVHAAYLKFFPNTPALMHLSLIILYGILILITALLLKRFSSSALVTGSGLLLFAVNDTHAYTAGWISGHNTLLSCIFGYAAILFFDKWYRNKWKAGYVYTILLFILSLISSEGGLALTGYLFSYTIFLFTGKIGSRIKTLTPFILISAAYLLFYSIHHYGVIGSDIYIEASAFPIFTLYTIINNTIVLTVSQLLSFPPLGLVLGSSIWGEIAALIILVSLGFVFRKFFFRNRKALFFGVGMTLSIIPFTLSGTQDRVLLWAGFGAAGLLAEFCAYQLDTISKNKFQSITGKIVLFNNVFLSLLFYIPILFFFLIIENSAGTIEKTVKNQNTIVFNSPMDIFFMYPAALRTEKREKWPEHVHCLYNGADTLIITRTGEKTLQARVPDGWFLTAMERFSRADRFKFRQDDTINLSLMDIAIVKVTPDGRPETVDFTVKAELNEIAWMKWEGNGPVPCTIPELGQEMRILSRMF